MNWKQNVTSAVSFIIPQDGRLGVLEIHSVRHPHNPSVLIRAVHYLSTRNLFAQRDQLHVQEDEYSSVHIKHTNLVKKWSGYFKDKQLEELKV